MNEEQDTNREESVATDKKKKIKRVEKSVLSVLLALVVAAVGFVAGWFGRWGALGKKKQSLLWAIDVAEENYYEDVGGKLYDNLFASFALDPYSGYYTADEYKTVVNEWNGKNIDAGFSIFTEEQALRIYQVSAGSSAEAAGITAGMYFLKFGRTEETMKSGNAEDYFSFVSSLKNDEEYCVLCGASENEAEAMKYTVVNGASGAGFSLCRGGYEPMRVYQVVGNSSADKAGLKRGMYILAYGASENKEEMTAGVYSDFRSFISSLKPDEKGNVHLYLQSSFDKNDADAPVYHITMQEYQASYCLYRDNKVSYRFRTKDGEKEKKPEATLTEEPLTVLDDDTAYIYLSEFTGNAAEEFKECLQKMKDNNRKNLILDLRGNGGGKMQIFAEIASYLLRETTSGAQRVAYAKFKNGATVSYSVKSSHFSDYFDKTSRISVLADEYTASASECLIGALCDYKTIDFSDIYLHRNYKGEARTYGKGIMQTTFENSNGSAIKLTAAQIYWPKSTDKTIHNVGVTTADGANAISSHLLPDAEDSFLQTAVGDIKTKPPVSSDSPSVSV